MAIVWKIVSAEKAKRNQINVVSIASLCILFIILSHVLTIALFYVSCWSFKKNVNRHLFMNYDYAYRRLITGTSSTAAKGATTL